MALIPNHYFDSVLALGRKPNSDWVATCFLCSKTLGEEKYHFLVTNKHVLENEAKLFIRLYNATENKYKSLRLQFQDANGMLLYSTHPTEDIAAKILRVGFLKNAGYEWVGFDVDKEMMLSTEYYEAGGSVGARVFMIGFPLGLFNITKNDPICRCGYIARKEDNGYLLDIQNFPGNSGSPIISGPEALALKNTKPLKRSVLIGMVSSYYPYRKHLIDTQTHRVVEERDENSGLASACAVDHIREVIDMELARKSIL